MARSGIGWRAGPALTAVALVATPAMAQERYNVGGERVAIYNLAGQVDVTGIGGDEVVVEVARGGADAARLRVEVGEIDGRQTLRVLYPSDRVVYDPEGWSGNTQLRVRRDGTWGGDREGGDRVRVSSRGGGLEAHADLRIGIPRGQQVDVHVAVGRIRAANVDGRIRLDTHSGGVSARQMSGRLIVDTGSGGVEVLGMRGDLGIDTGSGGVRVGDVTGSALLIDTGSGGVQAENVRAEEIEIDTGSGSIRISGSAARDVRLDTGSGSVEAELASDVDRVEVDTGSGGVTLRLPEGLGAAVEVETGSGGIEVDFPMMVTRRARDELEATIGDGNGRITIDTGSGAVRILRM